MFILALAIAGSTLAGCSKDDDDNNVKVGQDIETAFRGQYPDASRVEWEMKSGYYVADFRHNNTEAEAWYTPQAVWHMTETDVLFANLPQAVKDAFQTCEYAAWRVDDVDMLEYPDVETAYVIEVEQGKAEYDLYFSPDGTLLKAVADTGNSTYQPPVLLPEIKEYIAANYPQARITDVDKERNTIEVDITDGTTRRELTFTADGGWLCTKTDMLKADVPQLVLDALAASQYGSWQIDEVDLCETPDGDYYWFELESGNNETHLKISTTGTII